MADKIKPPSTKEKVLSKIPLIGGIFDKSQDRALEQLGKNQELYEGIGLPSTKWEDFNPEEYQYQGDFRPEDAQADLIQESPGRLAMQDSALSELAGLKDRGLSDVDELAFSDASQAAAQDARAARGANKENLAVRGLQGSGLEFALDEIANQGAAGRAHDANLNRAASAAQERALYQKAYMDSVSGARDQDYRTEAQNSDVISDFNKTNTGAHNAATQANIANRQQTSNANTDLRNASTQLNQQGRTQAGQQNFQNTMARAAGISGANTGVAQGQAAVNAANSSDRNVGTGLIADIVGLGKKKETK